MDKLLFLSELDSGRITEDPKPEATKWLEILNFEGDDSVSGPASGSPSETSPNALNEGGFEKFLSRQAPFPSGSLDNVTSGIRLLIQPEVKDPKAFFPGAIPFKRDDYHLMVDKMHLPLEVIDGTSVVGPFFWWAYVEDASRPGDGYLQMVCRKSDVQWKGTSRGWEMALSYSTAIRITSGYIRGTSSAGVRDVIQLLGECAKPACHPFLLPLLMLRRELSPRMEIDQRDIRENLRGIETAVSKRYGHISSRAPDYKENDVGIDSVNRMLADYQCKVMWKRPQSWISAIKRVEEAMGEYWKIMVEAEEERTNSEGSNAGRRVVPVSLHLQQKSISRRLGFMIVRLEGLESYAQVTLERLNIQREVMNSIISQRESRLSLAIAAQQRRIAHTTGQDSTSMKTLTMLGVMFLPGAFLSSIFGMSFFDFSDDIHNSVSPRLYIFFVTFVPMTIIILVFWWKFDQHSTAQADTEVSDFEMNRLEERIMEAIRDRTGARVTTGFSDNRAPIVAARHHDGGKADGSRSSRVDNMGISGFFGRISGSIWVQAGRSSGARRNSPTKDGGGGNEADGQQEDGGSGSGIGRDIELGNTHKWLGGVSRAALGSEIR